jgi:hypothetical protein
VLMTASKPSSSARAACEGTPMPASMISGTSGKCARSAFRPKRFWRPRPEPIGAPRHQHPAARPQQPPGDHEVLGGVGKPGNLRAQNAGRFREAKHVRLQRVVLADHLQFDPRAANTCAPWGRVTAPSPNGTRPYWQHLHAKVADQGPESPAGTPPPRLARSATVTTSARRAHRLASTAGEG